MNVGIYKIANTLNSKIYIGSSTDVGRRRNEHFSKLKNGKHPNAPLQNAWNKYGEAHFVFEVIEIVEDKNILVEREQYYIDLFKSHEQSCGYNLKRNAENMLGFNHTPETRNKMSIAKTGDGNSFYGKSHSDETKEKISLSKRGEKSSRSKLTEQDVLTIYSLLLDRSISIKDIADLYSVKENTISQIKNGSNWSHLYHLFDGKHEINRNQKLQESDVLSIYEHLKSKTSYDLISEQFGISKQTISAIRHGKMWKHLYHVFL